MALLSQLQHTLFFETQSYNVLEFTSLAGWLAREWKGSACLGFSDAGMTRTRHQAHILFLYVLGIVLKFLCVHSKHLPSVAIVPDRGFLLSYKLRVSRTVLMFPETTKAFPTTEALLVVGDTLLDFQRACVVGCGGRRVSSHCLLPTTHY